MSKPTFIPLQSGSNTFGDTVCRLGKSYQRTVLMRVIGLYGAVSKSLYSINITFGDPPLPKQHQKQPQSFYWRVRRIMYIGGEAHA
jgi:hypothetical protein